MSQAAIDASVALGSSLYVLTKNPWWFCKVISGKVLLFVEISSECVEHIYLHFTYWVQQSQHHAI